MNRKSLPQEHCFYSQVKSFEQTKIYLYLHIYCRIPLDVIIKCIDEYVANHSGLRVDQNSSNSERKYYSKPFRMEELKSFRLGAIYYSDPWVDHFTEFLIIVTKSTDIEFPTTLEIKRNIIPKLLTF